MTPAVLAKTGYVRLLRDFTREHTCWVHLYTNDPPLSKDTVRADFDELLVASYAPQQIGKFTAPTLRGERAFAVANVLKFKLAIVTIPPPVRGVFATDGIAGPLLWAWRKPGDPFQYAADKTLLTIVVTAEFPLCPE